MSRIGFGEILVILVLALLVIGPDKLPELAHSLGKAVRAMKKTIQETTEELDGAEELKELRDEVEGLQKELETLGRDIEKSVEAPPAAEEKPAQTSAEEPPAVPEGEPTEGGD
ncbi:MAG: Sec-independent protein translocase protein TatB [Oscillospiraceae bacterium]|nr:Sec-independent protein translocase protein TatB [Oscillospiraceae bacterium]